MSVEQYYQMHLKGKTLKEIAAHFGKSKSAIWFQLSRHQPYQIKSDQYRRTCKTCGTTYYSSTHIKWRYCSSKCGRVEQRKAGNRKLTDAQIQDLRNKREQGWLYRELATEFDISCVTAQRIIKGQRYRESYRPIEGPKQAPNDKRFSRNRSINRDHRSEDADVSRATETMVAQGSREKENTLQNSV